MILVMGGAYQGKLAFAYRLLGQGTDGRAGISDGSPEGEVHVVCRADASMDPGPDFAAVCRADSSMDSRSDFAAVCREDSAAGCRADSAEDLWTDSLAALCADGHVDPYDSAFEKKVVYGLHAYVRRLLSEEKPVEPFLEELAVRNPDAVVVTDEVGCGIVPADPFERAYREAVGRASARMAAECGSVYRVLCGIGMKIK